jgi:hypothetical protein
MSEKKERIIRAVIGGKPVRFIVEKTLAEADDRWECGRENTRWNYIEVMRTKKGNYILARHYITLWQGERSYVDYYVYSTIEELVKDLDPTRDLDRDILEQLGYLDQLSEEI